MDTKQDIITYTWSKHAWQDFSRKVPSFDSSEFQAKPPNFSAQKACKRKRRGGKHKINTIPLPVLNVRR